MSTEPFTPVPVRARRDGWTPERQAAFVAALRDTRSVVAACRAVGMSWQTAYRLRARPDAAGFAAAWDAALAKPDRPRSVGRALGGITTPIFYRGRQVGERRRYDNRLARYLLTIRRPDRYRDRHDAEDAPLAASDDWTSELADTGEAASRANVARSSSPSDADGPVPRQSGQPSRTERQGRRCRTPDRMPNVPHAPAKPPDVTAPFPRRPSPC